LQNKSNVLVLLAAIVAFVPIMASDFVVDEFVRVREDALLQRSVDRVASDIQAAVYEGIDAMSDVVGQSPSVCTPTFMSNLRNRLQQSPYLRQVMVENDTGVQYCDAFSATFNYTSASDPLPIPGRSETIGAVRVEGVDAPLLKITRQIDNSRRIAAFVHMTDEVAAGRSPLLAPGASYLEISLVSGSRLATIGRVTESDISDDPQAYLYASAVAGDVPVRIETARQLAAQRAEYSDLYVIFTAAACLMSATLLVLALQYVRKQRSPGLNLERAIVKGEIQPWYQPVIDLETGRVSGCEMLARWVKPNGEIIPPSVFIDYAEATGLAVNMTIALMERMRDDLSDIARENPNMRFSLNLFEGHFRDTHLVNDVEAIFGGSDIDYSQLVFEITERHPMADETAALTLINGLHGLGARLALDDVGTGHSNLAYIQTLGVDVLKIDRIFIKLIENQNSITPVLDGLITMAHQLNASVVAEGVETVEQAKFLRDRGVLQVQGYLFAAPMPAGKFVDMVRTLNAEDGTGRVAESSKAA